MLQDRDARFLIRDQDDDIRRTLDLLQGWGAPGREPLRLRVGRLLVRVGRWLQGSGAGREGEATPSRCGIR